jgi:antitoxin (DNA-binding transcriptional repressor) of toxin-antitoxin stability system
MKTATVADLRNNFRRISALIDNGESVDITKRGRVVARLVPPVVAAKKWVKPDIMAQLKEVWGDRVLTEAEVKELRDLELENHYG